MSVVWKPNITPVHDCRDHISILDQVLGRQVTGTIWQCDECGRYWEWDGRWFPVRWFHFIAWHRIASLKGQR